jgi:hypothetical protein
MKRSKKIDTGVTSITSAILYLISETLGVSCSLETRSVFLSDPGIGMNEKSTCLRLQVAGSFDSPEDKMHLQNHPYCKSINLCDCVRPTMKKNHQSR